MGNEGGKKMRTEGKLLRGGKKRHHRNRLTAALSCLCLLVTLLPSTAMAAGDNAPATLIVGNTDVISGGYWTTGENGKLSECDDSTEPPTTWNVHYEVSTNTLTLNGATITGEIDTTNPSGAGIYASAFTDRPVSLTIVLQGENKVSGDIGIYVWEGHSSTTGGATLTITGDSGGSLNASGSSNGGGIRVQGNNGDATLTIPAGTNLTNEGTINNSGTLSGDIQGIAPPSITTTSPLASGTVGTAYSANLTTNSTTTAASWSITAGSLPLGLNLDAGSGTIAGTPTTAGTYNFTVTATNGGGSDTKPLYITINAAQQSGGGGTTVPTYIRRTLSSNGITLSGSSIHRNASLTAIEGGLHEAGSCENCDRIRTWQAEGRVIALYDVSLSRSFRGNVTVTFPVSADYEGRTLTVVHCLNDSLDTSQAVVTDGTIRVTTDSLSPFAILDDKETSDDPFIDVNSDDWFYEDVMFVYEKGLIDGIEGVFSARMRPSPAPRQRCSFTAWPEARL